jgi:polyhydroxybutyrate depolymerase
MKRLFFLNFLLISAPVLFAQTNIDKTIMVDGKKRDYIIHLPANYQTLNNIPLIMALHGSGGKSEGTQKLYQLDPLADKYGYIVLYPQAIYKNWNIPGIPAANGKVDSSANDVQFISSLIDSTVTFYKGDSTRVFATGISRGGKFSLYLAYGLNKRLKAIAPVCASIPRDMKADYHFDKPIPVLLINGTADPLVNYNGGYGKLNVGDKIGIGFDVLPTEELVSKLVSINNCDSTAIITNMPDSVKGDGCTAIKYYYKSNKAPVEFIKIIGGGHTWPGGFQYLPKFVIGNVCKDFSAANEIFNFFISVTKQ